MTWRVTADERVEKDLRRAPAHIVDRFFDVMDRLAEDPLHRGPGLDIRRLHGRPGHRVRIGEYRILLVIDRQRRVVHVTAVGPRGSVY